MKLKGNFVIHTIDGIQYLIPVGIGEFSGFLRSNRTAAFIVDCLQSETTEEQIVDAMCEVFDAPRGQIAEDVGRILDKLRGIHALEE